MSSTTPSARSSSTRRTSSAYGTPTCPTWSWPLGAREPPAGTRDERLGRPGRALRPSAARSRHRAGRGPAPGRGRRAGRRAPGRSRPGLLGAALDPVLALSDADEGREDAAATRQLELEPARDDQPQAEEGEHGQGASSIERLLDLDFRAYGPDELRAARAVVERIARSLPLRRSYRMENAPAGRRIDMRQTLRLAMRTEGHPLRRSFR